MYFSDNFNPETEKSLFKITSLNLGGYKLDDIEIKVRLMNLITGINGTGKSVSNKILWFIGYIINIHELNLKVNPSSAEKATVDFASKVGCLIFDTPDLDAIVSFDSDIYSCMFEFKDSKISTFNLSIHKPQELKNIPRSGYASAKTRLFDEYLAYLKILKILGIVNVTTPEDLIRLNDFYRIYDVLNLEEIRLKCNDMEVNNKDINLNPIIEKLNLGDAFIQMDSSIIVKKSIPFIKTDQEIKKITNHSDGVQALIMMTFFIMDSDKYL